MFKFKIIKYHKTVAMYATSQGLKARAICRPTSIYKCAQRLMLNYAYLRTLAATRSQRQFLTYGF